jgi:hypothetical protein
LTPPTALQPLHPALSYPVRAGNLCQQGRPGARRGRLTAGWRMCTETLNNYRTAVVALVAFTRFPSNSANATAWKVSSNDFGSASPSTRKSGESHRFASSGGSKRAHKPENLAKCIAVNKCTKTIQKPRDKQLTGPQNSEE